MRNIIIGTAGHIDHGKTTLIKHLTGINTDTLPEEAKRGMTINLGFAYYKLPDNRKVGIIDVPGHEKFIKNMVAGASGIDFILLVVACDDGVMPQTIEHGNICSILGVNRGLVVLTKKDLVSEDRVKEVKDQIKEVFKYNFISTLPMVEVSSKDEKSFDIMKDKLNEEISKIDLTQKNKQEFRMAVDRVFSVKGFGTVVTGTTISGVIHEGDNITLYPRKSTHKVKGIQNHGEKVEYLDSGNRCALNIAGIETSDIKRGDIISKDSNLIVTKRLDAIFTLLGESNKLKNNTRIRLHLGTTEVIGRVKLLLDDEINDSKPAFIQLELEEDIVAVAGDIGVIRNYSPLDTIGGIKILNPAGVKVKKRDSEYIKRLEILAHGGKSEKIISILKMKELKAQTLNELEQELKDKIQENEIEPLLNSGEIVIIENKDEVKYLSTEQFNIFKKSVESYLKEFYEKFPLKEGVYRAELKNKLFKLTSLKDFNSFLDKLKELEIIDFSQDLLTLKEYKAKLSKEQKKIKDDILTIYKNYEFSPEYYDIILEKLEKKDRMNFQEVHEHLVAKGLIQKIGENLYMMRGFYVEAEKRLREYLELNKKITLSQYKDLLNTSRKFALILLDYFDEKGVTKRVEDYRVLK